MKWLNVELLMTKFLTNCIIAERVIIGLSVTKVHRHFN